jgi:hypothetical protein
MLERRLTNEDIDWLRKLRNAKVANQLTADIPTSVVRRLTELACAEVIRAALPRAGARPQRVSQPRARKVSAA